MSAFKKNLVLSGVILALSLSFTSVHAIPFGSEARSFGMGNVGVATADIGTAALVNPAMLSYQQFKEDFAILIAGGVILDDSDKISDSVDDFQSADDQFNISSGLETDPSVIELSNGGDSVAALNTAVNNLNTQIVDANAMLAAAQGIDGKVAVLNGGGSAVVGFSFEEYSFAFSARIVNDVAVTLSDLSFGTTLTPIVNDTADPVGSAASVLAAEGQVDALGANLQDPAQNQLNIERIVSTEIGLSVAKSFRWLDHKISIGLTPKIVTVERTSFRESITTGELDFSTLSDENSIVDLGDFVTFDLGAVVEISESTQFGLVIKNFAEHTINQVTATGTDQIVFSRQAKVGLAYRGNLFTIGADLDLLEADPTLPGAAFASKKTQMFSLGVEFNAWDFLQLRLGMQQNLSAPAGSDDTVATAGVGIWLGFNIDIAAMASENVLGAVVNAGFKF